MSSKRRKQNRKKKRKRNKKDRKVEFPIGTYICIRKQREGVGIVNKIGEKTGYLIAFKNGKWGWYRRNKINVINEDEYNDASSEFIIDKNLPSPSPTPSMSCSPSPTPISDINDENIQINNQQIKFKDSMHMEQNNMNESDSKELQESKMQIKIEQIDESENTKTDGTAGAYEQSELKTVTVSDEKVEVIDIEPKKDMAVENVVIASAEVESTAVNNIDDKSDEVTVNTVVSKVVNEEVKSMEIANNDSKQETVVLERKNNDKSDEIDDGNSEVMDIEKIVGKNIDESEIVKDENIELKSVETMDNDSKENDKHVKDVKIEKKNKNVNKKQKVKKVSTPKISKFEKKMRLYYKVKDLRERSFLIMCDENKMIDFKSLYEYIEHFGNIKPLKNKVKEFLNYMKPNGNKMVSFSKFVKAIDDDGDVIAGFNRFKKYGNARSKK